MTEPTYGAEPSVLLGFGGLSYRAPVRNGKVIPPKGVTLVPTRRPRAVKVPRTRTPDVRLALKSSPGYGPPAMTKRLVDALGNNTVASLLGVNKDRPGRWISGEASPNSENQSQLADLDALVGHLLVAFTPDQARLWLEGHNPHLGARPLDVYRLEGSAPVIEAIRAHEQGAFA